VPNADQCGAGGDHAAQDRSAIGLVSKVPRELIKAVLVHGVIRSQKPIITHINDE
jgi:hypothetical protein